ncbi:hypothetical protein L204_100571 [Cryptococcus depauperatus]|nr:hypothetical protein L204_01496 [Cryptococcus depauperatus CBS 7855]
MSTESVESSQVPVAALENAESFTSPLGVVLTYQTAGHYLSRYFQAIGQAAHYEMRDVLLAGYVQPSLSKKAAKKALLGTIDKATLSGPPPGSMRVCTINIPAIGPVCSAPKPNKQLAKQSASFQAITELYKHHEVDDAFEATPSQPCVKLGPGGLATKSKCNQRWESRKAMIKDQLPQKTGGGELEYQTTPEFWRECPPLKPGCLYASVLQLDPNGKGTINHPECRMMCLLTSKPLPLFKDKNSININIGVGEQPTHQAFMRLVNGGKMGTFNDDKLDQVLVFTEKLMRAQCQKLLRAELSKIKWLLVPLKPEYKLPTDEALTDKKDAELKLDDVSWQEVDAVTDGALTLPFTCHRHDILEAEATDAMATAASEMSRRSYIIKLRKDLTPHSAHPQIPGSTIIEVLQNKNTSLPDLTNPSQPIIEAQPVCLAKNGSYITTVGTAEKDVREYLIPEFQHRHCIPASIFRTLTVFPFFMHQLECMFIAWEMSCKLFQSVLQPELALQALTAPSSLNVPTWTYERLEILGDTLLKFIATIHFYLLGCGAGSNEDMLKVWHDRHKIVSNRTLAHNAVKLGLAKYIRDRRFKAKDWIPRDWEIESQLAETQSNNSLKTSFSGPEYRTLGDKLLADIVEAIIGAAYGSDRNFDHVIKTLRNLTVPLDLFETWDDIKRVLPPTKEENLTPSDVPTYMNFFNKTSKHEVLGYKFNSNKRFENVFSLKKNSETQHIRERYKMLGNAILDVHIIQHLLEKFPNEGPASLSNMKTFRTTEGLCCASAVELGLVDLLVDADDNTRREISRATYFMVEAKSHTDANYTADDEHIGEHYWESVAINHITGSIVEVLLGAIFEDCNFSIETTQNIFDRILLPFLEKYCKGPNDSDLHPKGVLTRWMQKKRCTVWKLDVEGPKMNEAFVTCHYKEIARLKSFSTLQAVRNVCNEAIKRLRDENEIENLCDCPSFKKTLPGDESDVSVKKKSSLAA